MCKSSLLGTLQHHQPSSNAEQPRFKKASPTAFMTENGMEVYLKNCWYATSVNGTALPSRIDSPGSVVIPIFALNRAQGLILKSIPEVIGLLIYALIFGLSLAVCIVSVHYLLKNWGREPSHLIVTGFTFLLLGFNIAVFGLRIVTVLNSVRATLCPNGNPAFKLAFQPDSFVASANDGAVINYTSAWNLARGVTLTTIPAFLWISDAFLVCRAWVIWVYRREYTIIPGVAYIASLVCGIIWIIQDYKATSLTNTTTAKNLDLLNAVMNWTMALGFSCGLDALTTGMIAGRLFHYDRKQRRLTGKKTTFYIPIVTIFIESAALSLISKILQLSLPSLRANPIVVPLCTTSSNLIVLRKVLGADVGRMMANREPLDLSIPSFKRYGPGGTNEGDVPGGFGVHLIQTIGGHTVNIGSFAAGAERTGETSLQDTSD